MMRMIGCELNDNKDETTTHDHTYHGIKCSSIFYPPEISSRNHSIANVNDVVDLFSEAYEISGRIK